MASKRRRHRSRPAPGEVRAVLAGGASADATGVDADKCGHGMSAFEGASVPAADEGRPPANGWLEVLGGRR